MPFPCRSYIVPLQCRAAKGLDCVFPIWFRQCGCVWFTHAMPRLCHATTMPFWKRLLKVTAQRGMGMAWHSMCELVSAVQIRHVGDLPAFGFFWLSRGVPWGYQKHTNPLNCRTSSSEISGYYADFYEGHGTVGEWQGRGMPCTTYELTRHGMAGERHGRSMACTTYELTRHGMAGERHGRGMACVNHLLHGPQNSRIK
jgi:hypothetical protein